MKERFRLLTSAATVALGLPKESGSLGRADRLAPTIFDAPKAFPVMRSLGKRGNSVQLRVGAPFAIEPALKPVSYASSAEGSTRDCDQPSLYELRLGEPICTLEFHVCRAEARSAKAGLHAAACGFLL